MVKGGITSTAELQKVMNRILNFLQNRYLALEW